MPKPTDSVELTVSLKVKPSALQNFFEKNQEQITTYLGGVAHEVLSDDPDDPDEPDKPEEPNPTDPVWKANEFEVRIDSGSDKLYRNGRQQVKVRVSLKPYTATDYMPYTLTAAELDSLQLIYYDKGANGENVLIPIMDYDQMPTTWGSSATDRRWDYYNGSSATFEPLVVEEKFDQNLEVVKSFWVTTVSNTPVIIGAQIMGHRNNGTKIWYSTNDENSNSDSVTLRPVEIPTYSRSNLVVIKDKIQGDSDAENDWNTVDYYSIAMQTMPGVGGTMYISNPRGIFKFPGFPVERGSLVGWTRLGGWSEDITYFSNPVDAHVKLVNGFPKPGYGTLVFVRRPALHKPSGMPTGTDQIVIFETQGNQYTVNFTIDSYGRGLVFS